MKIPAQTVARWTDLIESWMDKNFALLEVYGISGRASVRDGTSAWTIANRAGVLSEAYTDREVLDAHIQTALEKIFPNVRFKDPKRY